MITMARVLVVDDAAFMRKVVSDALSKGGHEVIGEASNGAEAIARYQELQPELTTLDITMPEMDGLTALKEIMAIDPRARIIMCSALGQESKVLEAIKAGGSSCGLARRTTAACGRLRSCRPGRPRTGGEAPAARRRHRCTASSTAPRMPSTAVCAPIARGPCSPPRRCPSPSG
jgi:two-component system chemotaxis response regulator CheY